jgi:hypothetical protein
VCKPSRFFLLQLNIVLQLFPQYAASGDRMASAIASLGNAGAFFMAGRYEDNIVQPSR